MYYLLFMFIVIFCLCFLNEFYFYLEVWLYEAELFKEFRDKDLLFEDYYLEHCLSSQISVIKLGLTREFLARELFALYTISVSLLF